MTSTPIATSKPSKLARKPDKKEAAPAKKDVTAVAETTDEKQIEKMVPKARAEGAEDKGEVTIEKKLIAL